MSQQFVSLMCAESGPADPPGIAQYFNHVFLETPSGPIIYKCNDGLDNLIYGTPQYSGVQDLDPVLIAGAIGGGFFALVPLWVAVFGFRKLLDAIH